MSRPDHDLPAAECPTPPSTWLRGRSVYPGRRALFGAALACGAAGCSSTGTSGDAPSPGPATTATIISGDNQVGLTGKALVHPLVIRVLRDGAPAAGVGVTWEASGGIVTPVAGTTTAEGVASVAWNLGEAGGPLTLTATVAGTGTARLTLHALAVVNPTALQDGPTVNQLGIVGAQLPRPLRVIVRSGSNPVPGVVVRWAAENGAVYPTTSLTGTDGSATTSWTLGRAPGTMHASATVERVWMWSPFRYNAEAAAGPPAIVTPVTSSPAVPANWPYWYPLQALVTDAFGNPLAASPVEWSVVSGSALLRTPGGLTLSNGVSQVTFAPTGTEGIVEIEARVPGIPAGTTTSAQFYLIAGPRQLNVRLLLDLNGQTPIFVSGQNGTSPAVDTIAVGTTMTWILDGWDYERHRIAPLGGAAFPDPGAFQPYEDQVQATFAVPAGTYTYWDTESGAMGTIVVE